MLDADQRNGFHVERRRIRLVQQPVHGAVHAPEELLEVEAPVDIGIFLQLVEGEAEAGAGAAMIAARVVVQRDGREDEALDEVLLFPEAFEPERLPGVVGLVEIARVEELHALHEAGVKLHRGVSASTSTKAERPGLIVRLRWRTVPKGDGGGGSRTS